MAPPVIIRVGCALDNSVEKTFRDFETRAAAAAKRAEQAMGRGGRGRGRVLDDGAVVSAKKVSAAQEQAAKKGADAQVAAEKKATASVQSEGKKQLHEWRKILKERLAANKNFLDEMKVTEARATATVLAEERKRERAQKASADRSRRELDRFATRTSHRTTRFLMPNAPLASLARRGVSDVLRGIGIDASISGAMGRSTELQQRAVALSTAGYIPGEKGPAGARVAAGTLQAEARATAEKFSIDPQSVIEAQDQFVKLTGDLATSRAMMGELSGMSIASGASLQDMATAAGELSNALGDMGSPEEKMKAISGALRTLAAQGKIGAVEIKDYARYMAHIGGAVGQFGGDRAQRIAQFGALTQLAKKYGGGTTAAVATRSISGFSETLSKSARRKMFKKHGVAIEDERGMFRDPFEIIKDAISKTGAKAKPMNEMFANVIGAKAVKGLSNVYKQAGGGEKGMAAIDAELKLMMSANSMTDKSIAEAVSKYEETTAAKAQKFQIQLDKIVDTAATKLIPALEKLAPYALKAAEQLGKLAQYIAENPGKAIGLAIAAAIARAGIESAFRTGIERVIMGMAGGTAPGAKGAKPGFMPAGGALGALSAGLVITSAAVTLHATGRLIIDAWIEAMGKKKSKEVMTDVQEFTTTQNLARKAREQGGELSEEDMQTLSKIEKAKKTRLEMAEKQRAAQEQGPSLMTGSPMGGGADPTEGARNPMGIDMSKEQIETLRSELGALQSLLKGTLTVTVDNIEAARTPAALPPNENREPFGS